MKKLLFLALLAYVGWYAYRRFSQSRTAQQIQQAPAQYVNNLQHDVEKAKQTEEQANKIIQQTSKQVKDLVDQAEKP